ncbi:1-hydroxycarotenoid 3,4-desaturase CrtD [Rhodocyclus tenuis]|uniref:1-hydroxycarotenoid 3,4-desaturase n=1 Tax=Rhodocyclus tenuis TaxID=1066 RepID=A0A840GCS1_RHOTE|nr:1-hydroxycarotenoid 3,4-desaturase CrtD [Rhodocyclus tenuis]MBB4248660.1 1-hydroxycarotenoid 3,4-desaturase [Rhodocyclus tenuis]
MRTNRVLVIGAGVGGLSTAIGLAAHGCEVIVLERATAPGGKLRQVLIGGQGIDAGPTVLTMRWVLEELFAEGGARLDDWLTLRPVETLARHAWSDGQRLDLFADTRRSAEAIGEFAGGAEAQRFRAFCARAEAIYRTLENSFLRAPRPTPWSLAQAAGWRGLPDLWRIAPFVSMWRSLGRYFHDPRLRQLFGRYATYCGSSPFRSPAVLMLVAHVEQQGVWIVDGGMVRIAETLAALAARLGASIRCDAGVAEIIVRDGRACGVQLDNGERIEADAVVSNVDVAAIGEGLFGEASRAAVRRLPSSARSLSALTWNMLAECRDFPLVRHNVFFSDDYASEFSDIFQQRRLPVTPTVYVCAQDRGDADEVTPSGSERLFCLVNAPATGDGGPFTPLEIDRCQTQSFALLQRCGMTLTPTQAPVLTTPAEFNALFPATGGALYGPASHGWRASFLRPGSRSRLPGLYLSGGSTHPGPGAPMAALSGRLAAASVLADLSSTRRSVPVATAGGMSTR